MPRLRNGRGVLRRVGRPGPPVRLHPGHSAVQELEHFRHLRLGGRVWEGRSAVAGGFAWRHHQSSVQELHVIHWRQQDCSVSRSGFLVPGPFS